MKWTARLVAEVLGVTNTSDVSFTTIETDTRLLTDGALFVALVGEHHDGHAFLHQAQRAGAMGAVVRTGTPPIDGLWQVEVEDTLVAYGQLARHRRRQLTGPVVAVTGTNGKTATKEMIAHGLNTTWRTYWTAANENNRVGVPKTILAAPSDTEALVIEAGANARGEIAALTAIAEPTVAVVTNVSEGHLEGFGDVQDVMNEKLSLVHGAQAVVVGTSPSSLCPRARELHERVIEAGLTGAECSADSYTIVDGAVALRWRGHEVTLPVLGEHQGNNAMIALAVADELGVPVDRAMTGLRRVQLPGGRCEIHQYGALRVLNDAYNANPASMRASLLLVQDLGGERRLVLVLGSMLELGSRSAAFHEEIAQAALAVNPYLVVAVGEFATAFPSSTEVRVLSATDADAAASLLQPHLNGNEFVLLKGSRGVRLERILPLLESIGTSSCSTTS